VVFIKITKRPLNVFYLAEDGKSPTDNSLKEIYAYISEKTGEDKIEFNSGVFYNTPFNLYKKSFNNDIFVVRAKDGSGCSFIGNPNIVRQIRNILKIENYLTSWEVCLEMVARNR